MDDVHEAIERLASASGDGDVATPPDAGEWQAFLRNVSRLYADGERERERLERRAEEAQQSAEAQASFLANMSHELRTPLNAVIGYSELVLEDAETFGYHELTGDLVKIRRAGRHLVSLVNDVLDMSKIQAGCVELDVQEVDVGELLEEVVAAVEPGVVANANEFVLDWDDGLGTIRTDPTKLRQVLTNLLSNAGKFTSEGTVRLSARVVERHDRFWVRFEVADTGIGIAPDKIERVFEPFRQADESTTRRFGGTGLGLSICVEYCEMLGARLDVDSTVGEGSTFRISMPTGLSGPRATGNYSHVAPNSTANLPALDPALYEQRRTLLVIDDEPSVHEVITRFLADGPYEIHSASTGGRGLELAGELDVDAVIVDILMEDMSGWEVLAQLKVDEATAEVPVMVCSILDEEVRARRLGADAFFQKPVVRGLVDQIAVLVGSGVGSNSS